MPIPTVCPVCKASAFEIGTPDTKGIFGFALASSPPDLEGARIVVHELGHVVNLRHRGSKDTKGNAGVDFVGGGITKNLMFGSVDEKAGTAVPEDLDLAQLIITRNSLLLPPDSVFAKP